MKHIGLDLVRTTEAAAIAASYYVGSGDKETADKAATDAIRNRLNKMDFLGKIVIGEGKKDKSYGLFTGEYVGKYVRSKTDFIREYDIAIDPIEGTRPTVNSGPEALSVITMSEKDSMFSTEEFYMNKLAYGPKIVKKAVPLSLNDPIEYIIDCVCSATGKPTSRVMVCILERPRHEEIIKRIRAKGTRIKLIQDCDVSGAIATCFVDRGVDLLYGIGGAPESVITACALKCMKGGFQSQIVDKEGKVLDQKIYAIEDLVKGPCIFAATGITNGSLLRGVRFTEQGPVTNSLFMRSESGTIRWLTTYHGN